MTTPSTIRVCRGVHRPSDHLLDDTDRVDALLAACSHDAVVCGWSAARLHGLWLPDRSDDRLEVIVDSEVVGATSRSYHRRPKIRARRQELRADDVVVVDGIAVTSPAKTWVDLADRLAPCDLLVAGDSALRGTASPDDLVRAVERARRCRGVVRAREVLPPPDARSRSRPESLMRHAVLAAGLPAPDVNVAIYSSTGEWLAEPDLSYKDVRLAIEYNGRDHADTDRMRRDITRTLDVEDRGGWRVVVFGPVQVFRRPDQVARWVRRLRRERGGIP